MKIFNDKYCFIVLMLIISFISNILCTSSYNKSGKNVLSKLNLKQKYVNKISNADKKKDDFRLFSFIDKIKLKLPNNSMIFNPDMKSSLQIQASRSKFNRNEKRQSQNIYSNIPVKEGLISTYNSLNNTNEEIEIVEVYSTSDMISNKELLGNCFLQYNGFFYDLSRIKWQGSSTTVNTIKTEKNTTVYFDLCNNIEEPNCPDDISYTLDRENCISFASSVKRDKLWKFVTEEHKKNEGDGHTTFKKEKILLTSRSGEEFNFGMKYRVKFEIECDMNQLEPIVTNHYFNMDDSYDFLNIYIKSRYGCPIRTFQTWIDKLGLFRIGAGYILIICGIILVFKGLYYYLMLDKKNHFLNGEQKIIFNGWDIKNDLIIGKVFISILNGFNISLIIYSYAIIFFDIDVFDTLLVALFCGYISYIKFYSNITFQILVYANLVASLAYNAFFAIFVEFSPILSYYLILIGVILLTFSYRFRYFDTIKNPIITHCVSLLASYMIVRGISFIVGTYPDEGLMYELLAHQEFSQVHQYFYREGYIYLTFTLMLYGVFIVLNKFMIKSTRKLLEKESKEGAEQALIGGEMDAELLTQSSNKSENDLGSSNYSWEKNKDIIREKI